MKRAIRFEIAGMAMLTMPQEPCCAINRQARDADAD
jgi:hypothetical protein